MGLRLLERAHYTGEVSQLAALGLESRIWSPSELNRHLRQLIESDYRLSDVWLAGEAGNIANPASGHLYFSLRDSEAAVRCVMWRSEVAQLRRLPQDGEALEVHGHLSVYEAGGQVQLYADELRYAGEGELFQQYLRLKQQLEQEGLFDPQRKRELPAWPRRIGVVTSPTGAALRDVLNVLRRRYPLVEVLLSPTAVQGEAAPARIAAALQALNAHGAPDVILLVRGGGSLEDLWAFNIEAVVRAVAESAAPVVSGIGHETDLLLSDLAADLRAPTPSAAADLATPDRRELRTSVNELRGQLGRVWHDTYRQLRAELLLQRAALERASPRAQVANARQRVDELLMRAGSSVRHAVALRRAAVDGLVQTLGAVGPQAVLERGYAIVRRIEDDRVVRSVDQVHPEDLLQVRVSDGHFPARVTEPPNDNE